jgi:hypothetical protein
LNLLGVSVKSSVPMIKKLKRKKSSRPAWSESQTARYKELVGKLEGLGFVVRREELKRGHCWKVLSGVCRSLTQKFVFIDSRLNPDEQVAFLGAKLTDIELADMPVSQPLTSAA